MHRSQPFSALWRRRSPPSDVDSLRGGKASQGQIRTHERKDGLTTYSVRVRAYGRREVVTLRTDGDGWTMRKAERALDQILAEIQVVRVATVQHVRRRGGPDVSRVRVAVVVCAQVGAAADDAGRLRMAAAEAPLALLR